MSNRQGLILLAVLIMLCVSGTTEAASGIKAYSMLTHDGRRLVSHVEGTSTVFELVHTNALPANLPPDFDHYELWRDGQFLANVTNEVPNGIPYRVARYVDLGLPTHSRHEYRIRKVWKDGRKDPLGEPFYGLTRFTQANSNSHVRKE